MKKLLLGVILLPMMVLADSMTNPDGVWTDDDGVEWKYYVRDGKAFVAGYYIVAYSSRAPAIPTDTAGSITIPETLGGAPVVGIEARAFYTCSKLTAVSIPSSVTSIGKEAFRGCGLSSVTIPEGVERIGKDAFVATKLLNEHADGFVIVDNCMVAYKGTCSGALEIPDEVRVIADGVFSDCSGLTSVTIPAGVTSVGYRLFSGCTKLTSVTIPPSVTSIGQEAFCNCSKLTSMEIPEGVTNIGIQAFDGCSGLTSAVTIPNGVTIVADHVFSRCSGLTSVTIPSGVTYVGCQAFYGCSGLKSVRILSSMANIEEGAFERCTGIETLEISDVAAWTEKVKLTNLGSHPLNAVGKAKLYVAGKEIKNLVIPECVTSVGKYAFYNCGGLTSVEMPSCITNIGTQAFEGCRSLTSVTIPACVRRLSATFGSAYTKIVEVVLCEGVTSVQESAFSGCNGLTSVKIPASVTSIGANAFLGCGSLTSVTIPEGVSSIGESAFSGCNGLTSVKIPEGVSSIGESAFANCGKLADVRLLSDAAKVTIGDDAFAGCYWDLVVHVPEEWTGKSHVVDGIYFERDGSGTESCIVNLTITNVVVNYVLNSIPSEDAIPATSDTGFVNIISEVKGGIVSVPESWAEEYPNFVSKYGSDFTKALAMKSGKKDGAGNEMLVWQDYVAGTDPTDENDVFRASITIVDGKVTISYTPELDDERKAMRKYTTWGKTSLMDTDWTEVQEGHEAEYNFFKVSVEMR